MINYSSYLYVKYCIANDKKTVIHLKKPKTEHELKALIDLSIWCATRMGSSKEEISEEIKKAMSGSFDDLFNIIGIFFSMKGIKFEIESQ